MDDGLPVATRATVSGSPATPWTTVSAGVWNRGSSASTSNRAFVKASLQAQHRLMGAYVYVWESTVIEWIRQLDFATRSNKKGWVLAHRLTKTVRSRGTYTALANWQPRWCYAATSHSCSGRCIRGRPYPAWCSASAQAKTRSRPTVQLWRSCSYLGGGKEGESGRWNPAMNHTEAMMFDSISVWLDFPAVAWASSGWKRAPRRFGIRFYGMQKKKNATASSGNSSSCCYCYSQNTRMVDVHALGTMTGNEFRKFLSNSIIITVSARCAGVHGWRCEVGCGFSDKLLWGGVCGCACDCVSVALRRTLYTKHANPAKTPDVVVSILSPYHLSSLYVYVGVSLMEGINFLVVRWHGVADDYCSFLSISTLNPVLFAQAIVYVERVWYGEWKEWWKRIRWWNLGA